jgi:hypothetical protein
MKSCIDYINSSFNIGKVNSNSINDIVKIGFSSVKNNKIMYKYFSKDINNIISKYNLYSFKYNIELYKHVNNYIHVDVFDLITGFNTYPNSIINIEFNGLHVFDLTSDINGEIKLDYPINKYSMIFSSIYIRGVDKITVNAILFVGLPLFIDNKNEYYRFLESHKKKFVYYKGSCLSEDLINCF